MRPMIFCVLPRIRIFQSPLRRERAPQNYEVFSNGRRLSADEMPIQRAAAGKNAILAEELEIRFVEGDSKCVLCNALPLFHENGRFAGPLELSQTLQI